jgi:hypothetical protein
MTQIIALMLLCIATVALYAHFVMRIPSWRGWRNFRLSLRRDMMIGGNCCVETSRSPGKFKRIDPRKVRLNRETKRYYILDHE